MKRVVIFLAAFAVLLLITGGVFLLRLNKTDMNFIQNGEAVFKYESLDNSTVLSQSDLSIIIDIFNNKRLYKDTPSCGFSENVAIYFNNHTEIFCIACDTCPIIYWKNKDRYFHISEEENILLKDILENYGFIFPCV